MARSRLFEERVEPGQREPVLDDATRGLRLLRVDGDPVLPGTAGFEIEAPPRACWPQDLELAQEAARDAVVAASRVVFVRVPSELWPALLSSSSSPSSLSRFCYALRKCVCVLSILSSVSRGGSVAAGARLAGVHPITGWRWMRSYERAGLNGLVPLTHRAGRKAILAVQRKAGVLLPVRISLDDVRLRKGRIHFAAALRPVLNSHARRQARKAVSEIEHSLPGALHQILNRQSSR